jgi:hypothetical protein
MIHAVVVLLALVLLSSVLAYLPLPIGSLVNWRCSALGNRASYFIWMGYRFSTLAVLMR